MTRFCKESKRRRMSSPTAPPLPPGEPPLAAFPPLPPPTGCYGAYGGYESSMPQVSALLMREAEAWRALLSLHTGVLGAARQLTTPMCEGGGETRSPMLETMREAIEAREAHYYSGLTQLAARCDQMATEALRLRALRKTRQGVDVNALEGLLHAHATETLAIGGALAANAAVAVAGVTSELRQATQATRQHLAQVRTLMQLVQDQPGLKGRVQLAYNESVVAVGRVFDVIHEQSEELTDESLVQALDALTCGSAPPDVAVAAPPDAVLPTGRAARQTVRRHTDGNRPAAGR